LPVPIPVSSFPHSFNTSALSLRYKCCLQVD
jgi:hypothetical protein